MNLPVEQVNEKFEAIGLLPNGKPVSFAKFKSVADAHQYGRGRSKLYIVFIGHPRENLFAFYPPQTTKADSLAISYEYYLDTVTTELKQEYLDENVMWGNRGYPVSYGGIGVW